MFSRLLSCTLLTAVTTLYSSLALASSAHEQEAVSLNPLSWEWIQQDLALWTVVVFVFLVLILTKFAWRPIIESLDKRERNVADQLVQAEEANRKAQNLLAEYERKLADAANQVQTIIAQGRREAEQIGQELIAKAKQEAQAEHQRALARIESATAAAVKELADRSAELAVELAGKIVKTKLKPQDHAELIERAVAGFVNNRN